METEVKRSCETCIHRVADQVSPGEEDWRKNDITCSKCRFGWEEMGMLDYWRVKE